MKLLTLSILAAACLSACATPESETTQSETNCEALVAHVVDLDLRRPNGPATTLSAEELEVHRAAREKALSRELLPTCDNTYSVTQIECHLNARTVSELAACRTKESK